MRGIPHVFSPAVLTVLSSAGWSPSHRNPHAHVWIGALEAEGFTVVPRVSEILRAYGGLCAVDPVPGIECARARFCLDPMLASGEIDYFRRFEGVLGPLFPLGEVEDGLAFLALGSTGAVYSLFDGIADVADSFEQALDNLATGRKFRRLPWE